VQCNEIVLQLMKSFLDELKLELRRTSSIINFMLR